MKAISTKADLARHLGRHRATVGRWIHHFAWPFGPGPWRVADVPKMLAWAEEWLQPDRASPAYYGEGEAAAIYEQFPELQDTAAELRAAELRQRADECEAELKASTPNAGSPAGARQRVL